MSLSHRIFFTCISSLGALWLFLGRAFAQPVLNEIHYDPPVRTEPAEFVEIHNPSAAAVSLGNWRLDGAVRFTFPSNTLLPPDGYVVVAQNPVFLLAKYGAAAVGPWSGRLSGDGETIELRDAAGLVVDQVDFRLGFPWPTVGDEPGYSIELIHPSLDNSLGGNWRASAAGGVAVSTRTSLFSRGGEWSFFRGRSEASSPSDAWRAPGFDDSSWERGRLPLGYDPSLAIPTPLDDMRNSYISVFLRREFDVAKPEDITSLEFAVLYDDGFKLWINGRKLTDANIATRELPFDSPAGTARESNAYETFAVNIPPGLLSAGRNVIAIQAHNTSLGGSSDFFFDASLTGVRGPTGVGPTPGRINVVFATNAPPAIRQVSHEPRQPRAGQTVVVSAKASDPDGVSGVTLLYQVVEPGAYIERGDPEFESASRWAALAMKDDGTGADAAAGDGVFSATVPASVQTHRRLVRYLIEATDGRGGSVRVPYPDDPQPNFAWFVYDGVPGWTGAVRPGDTGALGQSFTVAATEMNRLPVLHLLARRTAVEQATWTSRYGGDAYLWSGTLVFNGEVYDHIRFRARGGVWRYAMCKNMWKFDFNRGHDFDAVDDWGRPLDVKWSKLNLGASIQQGDYNHRGEQGMLESVGFRVFRLAGVPAVHSAYAQFRVVDDASEAPADNQHEGDFWGVYLMLEQPDGRFLDQHGLPDANLYKMEGGTGELNNLGPAGPVDRTDLDAFLRDYDNNDEGWWRTNFNVANYLSYQTVAQAIHHYDICYDKNFFYYRNPADARWQVIPWDLDLTWAENMYDAGCGGVDRIKQRLIRDATRVPAVWREWQNRIREFRDLFWNQDEAWRLVDEQAGRLRGPATGPTLLDADRAQWDYNPRMRDSRYSTSPDSKAGQGRFYKWPNYSAGVASRDFDGCLQILKRYVSFRASNNAARARPLDAIADDPGIPSRPGLIYSGPPEFPVNALRFGCSAYSGATAFGRQRWRVGEVTRPSAPSWAANAPWKYEIESVWESGDRASFEAEIQVPGGVLRVGATYRARVQFEDAVGRTSHWSEPVEFVAGAADTTASTGSSLRLTEIMYQAPGGATNDYLELHNAGALPVSLEGFRFSSGVDFVFPAASSLAPGAYAVVVRADPRNNFVAFRAFYGLDATVPIFGPYTGNLNDGGERLLLKDADGANLIGTTYSEGRGWPVAAAGAGHSLVPRRAFAEPPGAALDYGGNWRASAFVNGSPGRADPAPDSRVVVNEVVAHTDFLTEFDSNDWIELHNPTASPVPLGDAWYLSDDRTNLKRWRIPAGVSVPARGFLVIDEETGFNNPRGSGFSIDKAGDTVLLSHFPVGAPGGVVDAVAFKGQENDWALARFPDGAGMWDAVTPRSPGVANAPAPPRIAIGELLFHGGGPATNTLLEESMEFVELHNASGVLAGFVNEAGTWRLAGGISFDLPGDIALSPGERIVVVPFDPRLELATLAAFRRVFDVPAVVRILGPYSGRLQNDTDRVALERPQRPDRPGDPISWVVADEITYLDRTPWPAGADGEGGSLHRRESRHPGNEPSNWTVAVPTPGTDQPGASLDSDGDGMPDAWELANGLNPQDPRDAAEDDDHDGLANAAEFKAGTNPGDAASVLRWTEARVVGGGGGVEFEFLGMAEVGYVVDASSTGAAGSWTPVRVIQAQAVTAPVTVRFDEAPGTASRLFRLRVP